MTMDPGLKTEACGVCRGTGTTYLEHPDGSLSEEVCPYCHGAKNNVWRFDAEMGRNSRIVGLKGIIWGYSALYVLTWYGKVWRHDYTLKWVHAVLFLVAVVGLLWAYGHPAPRRRPKRPPNPLTTDQERLLGAAVIGGAMLKAHHDTRVRRQNAQLNQIAQQQAQILRNQQNGL